MKKYESKISKTLSFGIIVFAEECILYYIPTNNENKVLRPE